MGTWYVQPSPVSGWQVLTPHTTQAALADSRTEAVWIAGIMAGDEGGGSVITLSQHGDPEQIDTVQPSAAPHFRSVRRIESPDVTSLWAEDKAVG